MWPRAFPDVETPNCDRSEFEQAQTDMVVSGSGIPLDNSMSLKNGHKPMNSAFVQLHLFRKVGKARILFGRGKGVNNCQCSVEYLNLIR